MKCSVLMFLAKPDIVRGYCTGPPTSALPAQSTLTCGTPSTRQQRPSGHVAHTLTHTPTSKVRWSWCAGERTTSATRNF